MNGTDTFLDINNAHLRVNSGNVQASTFVLDQINIVTSANTNSTVNFNNVTKAFNAASNIEVGTANLFVDTSTSNVGIGTNAPQDTLHINGGTRISGHILPTVNDTYDLGSAEYKIRHLFLGNTSLWLGDETRITFTGGKMKFRRRKKNALPRGLATIAANRGHTSEQQTTTAALAHAGVSTVEEMKLEHWIDYTKTLDETKEINDIFTEDANDYEATTASEAFKEIGDDIFSAHNVSIGKSTAPTSALDVVGTVKATAFEGDGSALTGIVAGQWTESSGDIQRSSGNVGIGKIPDAGKKLDVNGTVKATAFEGDGSALTGITSGQWTESSGDIYRSSGNVGVGTNSPEQTLHVAGTMRIANATTNTETTDIVKIAAVNTTTTTSTPHTSWSQEQKLLAYQPSAYDYFGQQSAVSGDGNTICVGARNEDTTAGDSGAVYVYTYGSGTWTYRARLKASDAQASDVLGEAGLAISDDGRTIVVAARLEDTGGTSAGAAYVFMSSNSTWTSFTQQKLQASNKAADDQFCRCDVSGDGNTIIVGAPHEDGPTNSVASSGAAYIYSRSGDSWSEDQILYPSDPVVNNYFGVDNALNEDGTVAAIAATGDDTTATDSGAVYIFTKSNGTWSQETKLKVTSGGPNASDHWGGVSLSDDGLTLSAGTSNDDTTASNSGAVYVFNKSGGTWSQTVKLKASNAGADDKLGGRTRISGTGDTIVSGAREEDTGVSQAGSAYIFTLNNGTWTQRQQIQASDRASWDLFGDSVGISKDGTVICVGAVLEDGGGGDSGSVYAFRGSGGGTTTTTTTIDSRLKVNDTIVATAFEGDGSALTGITSGQWTESGGNIYKSSGNVGIGTTSPHVPIHVVGGFGSLSSAYCIYAKGNDAYSSRQFHLQTNMGWNNLSIYASDDIVTGQYLVSHLGTLSSSDERIKENIVDVDDASALELFRLLKPKKYQYIDKIKRGDDTVFGFIAQDVEKTMPHGTRKVEQTIPNIMEIGTVTETNIITLSNFNTSDLQSNIHILELHDKEAKPILVTIEEVIDEHSIRVDKDLSEFLYEYDENGNDITESVTITESEYNALEDVSGYIYNENAKTYTKILTNKIYVYGERIDNFLKLNKDTIWTVSTAALQEVDRQQQTDKARITELESQLTAVLARLDALENA